MKSFIRKGYSSDTYSVYENLSPNDVFFRKLMKIVPGKDKQLRNSLDTYGYRFIRF